MKVSFVQKSGYNSGRSNLWNLATGHQSSKKHIMYHTAYQLLGNINIACALDEATGKAVAKHNKTAERYRRMLHYHIDIVIFLAAQGLGFRGHDESATSSNRGNFIELMDLLAHYSQELRSFLDKERVTYTSHDPQNELIDCIAEEVRSEIRHRISHSKYLAVMMDDTSDCSNVEQSAVSIRLLHDGKVEEHLLGLIDSSEDQSAEGLTKVLLSTLSKFEVTPENSKDKLIGQSYDGAPAMSGHLNGVQARMLELFPVAYYNHCVAHRMSLCASRSANKIPRVAKFFGTTDKIVTFFRSSPKRANHLGHNLPKPGDTRWLSRDSAIRVIDNCYETIGTVLFEIANDRKEKAETQSFSRGLGIQIQAIEFIFMLKLYRKIFEYCTPMITVMQRPTLDPVIVKSMLNDFHTALNDFDFNQIWEDSMQLDPIIPTVRARVGWRNMEAAINGPENWKISLVELGKEIVTMFLSQLAWRFLNLEKFKWINLVHPTKFFERKFATSSEQRALLAELRQLYPFAVTDPVATEYNLNVLYNNSEIAILLKKVVRERDEIISRKLTSLKKLQTADREESSLFETEEIEERDEFQPEQPTGEIETVPEGIASIQDLLTVIKGAQLEDALPQAVHLLELAVVIPLTSVHCERVFSRMKRVISSSRANMMQTRKNNLVFLQVEHELLRNLAKNSSFKDVIVDRFKVCNQRRYDRFSKK